MTADEIRKTTQFTDQRSNTINALDNGTSFWLREIAAQLSDANMYSEHQGANIGSIFLKLETLEATVRMIGVHLQEQEQNKGKSKSLIAAEKAKRGD